MRLAAMAASAVLALAAGACGGSGEQGDTGGGSEARQGFADCLRDQGVEPPQRERGGDRPPFEPGDPDIQLAFQACRDQLPEGAGPGGLGGFGSPPAGDGGSDGEGSSR